MLFRLAILTVAAPTSTLLDSKAISLGRPRNAGVIMTLDHVQDALHRLANDKDLFAIMSKNKLAADIQEVVARYYGISDAIDKYANLVFYYMEDLKTAEHRQEQKALVFSASTSLEGLRLEVTCEVM